MVANEMNAASLIPRWVVWYRMFNIFGIADVNILASALFLVVAYLKERMNVLEISGSLFYINFVAH